MFLTINVKEKQISLGNTKKSKHMASQHFQILFRQNLEPHLYPRFTKLHGTGRFHQVIKHSGVTSSEIWG